MPNRFVPISASSSLEDTIRSTNSALAQLDNENITKTFKGLSGNSIIQGRLPYGGYGQLYYDSDGVARILIGMSPDDGRMGIWVSEEGQDVLELLES